MNNAITIEEITDRLAYGQVLAGLDLGEKTIGLAVSDGQLSFAHARPVIARKKFSQDAEALLASLAGDPLAGFVIGLPNNLDGSAGPRAQATRAFVRNMQRVTALPFIFWDERLSTVAVERAMIDADVSRAKRATKIDSAAAAFILQGALDRIAMLRKR
ncbi:Holliday junction resolvase RuvX [Notoacmeibacter sp. MSK16QG-6]|uniref:Holliday junction resolvase RuvX n=1 Tax=Notoacmeibacter sp. MSK16QG-6 TaxID=2957982 RepID=UPI0020A0CE84|nr:Holliday junction resolvase RuvX [Notoacmeibacter sp. MSK16QG-6]MCP1197880.1 Holliday junction resolvase RuvX [Notoacmeibacter sp. MSK16QG-6]